MTKFEKFLKNYNVVINKNELNETLYKKIRNLINGKTINPTSQTINEIYDFLKHKINYNRNGLANCFYTLEPLEKSSKPIIYTITTDCKMYNSLFCNKIIKEQSKDKKILVFDEDLYSNISEILISEEVILNDLLDYRSKDPQSTIDQSTYYKKEFDVSNIPFKSINNYIYKTNNENVDLVYIKPNTFFNNPGLSINTSLDITKGQLNDIFRTFLLNLTEYDLIIFNIWIQGNVKSSYVEIADYLFQITNLTEEKFKNYYDNHILLNNNYILLKTNIHNFYKHIQTHPKKNINQVSYLSSVGIVNTDYLNEENEIKILSDELIKELDTFYKVFSSKDYTDFIYY